HVDRHCRAQVIQDLVTKSLIGRADGRTSRLGDSHQTFDNFNAAHGRLLAPDVQGCGPILERQRSGVATCDAALFETEHACWQRRKRVRLRNKTGHEKFHQVTSEISVRRSGDSLAMSTPSSAISSGIWSSLIKAAATRAIAG